MTDNHKFKSAKEAGAYGEQKVSKAIDDALTTLLHNKPTLKHKEYDNYIFKVRSIFGVNGIRYTEIDKIVVTENCIFLFEIKFQNADVIKESITPKKPRKKLSNPIIQNRNHKLALAEILKVDLDCIITVECLLKSEKVQLHSPTNDYILFGDENLSEEIEQILYVDRQKIEFDRIVELLEENRYNFPDGPNKVEESIERRKKISRYLTNELDYPFLSWTSVAKCPICDCDLSFGKKNDKYLSIYCTSTNSCTFHGKLSRDVTDNESGVSLSYLKSLLVKIEKRCENFWTEPEKITYNRYYYTLKEDGEIIDWKTFYALSQSIPDIVLVNHIAKLKNIASMNELIDVINKHTHVGLLSKLIIKAINLNMNLDDTVFMIVANKLPATECIKLAEHINLDLSRENYDEFFSTWDRLRYCLSEWDDVTCERRISKLKKLGTVGSVVEAIISLHDVQLGNLLYDKALEFYNADLLYYTFVNMDGAGQIRNYCYSEEEFIEFSNNLKILIEFSNKNNSLNNQEKADTIISKVIRIMENIFHFAKNN